MLVIETATCRYATDVKTRHYPHAATCLARSATARHDAVMGIMQSLRHVDQRVIRTRRSDESRRDYLARLGSRTEAFTPREVYAELVVLHDKVATLEATVVRLQAEAAAAPSGWVPIHEPAIPAATSDRD